ncbi:MAG: histone H1, partial [Phycisphaerae bacterium]
MQEYEDLKRLVDEAESDIRKAEGGNKAAGTRVRKQMQQIKSAAQTLRNKVLELRTDE